MKEKDLRWTCSPAIALYFKTFMIDPELVGRIEECLLFIVCGDAKRAAKEL
jgi:hypothetical protein